MPRRSRKRPTTVSCATMDRSDAGLLPAPPLDAARPSSIYAYDQHDMRRRHVTTDPELQQRAQEDVLSINILLLASQALLASQSIQVMSHLYIASPRTCIAHFALQQIGARNTGCVLKTTSIARVSG